jgi:TRAP-type uncharacterized transport system fused permease subunit
MHLVSMSVYHFWASGFGTIREVLHRGIHISYVIGLVFILFSWKKKKIILKKKNFLNFQNINLLDYIFAFLAVYFSFIFTTITSRNFSSRVGNPTEQ